MSRAGDFRAVMHIINQLDRLVFLDQDEEYLETKAHIEQTMDSVYL